MRLPDREMLDAGFPGTFSCDPRVLILGSFLSRKSLLSSEYYGNPKNNFWTIMENLLPIDRTLPYEDRILALGEHHIVLWDIIRSCSRKGSGDWNGTGSHPQQHPGIYRPVPGLPSLIVLNGIIARRYFDRLMKGNVINVVTLPSTSPAHARLTIGEKTDRWRIICPYLTWWRPAP